ncbi:MAG TPA: archease [Deltaproteobacteria bacterium]|jgi:SHS2 domain-containing protein|nr:archease [Deltaproteobacteria bacterium]
MKAGFAFVEGATSDLAFVAQAATLDALFAVASEALLAATVEDPSSVAPSERRTLSLAEPDLELLLLRFLNELVWLRDAKGLLLRAESVRITREEGEAQLEATLVGEPLSRIRHALAADVKAATAHGLRIEGRPEGFEARVTLDV